MHEIGDYLSNDLLDNYDYTWRGNVFWLHRLDKKGWVPWVEHEQMKDHTLVTRTMYIPQISLQFVNCHDEHDWNHEPSNLSISTSYHKS